MLEKNSKQNVVLKVSNVNKNFGGVTAANNITFDLYENEVLGLIGPNGAGKTTLLNMISGILHVDSGDIFLNGEKITNRKPHYISKSGILRTFQHPRLLANCSLKTNLQVGSDLAARRGLFESENHEKELEELLSISGLSELNLAESTDKATYGQRKLLEIVRSLLSKPEILLLDEPAAGLNNREILYVVALINYALENNISVILIEHSMDLVMNICDRITVLNFGTQIGTDTPIGIQRNQKVIEAYLGGGDNA